MFGIMLFLFLGFKTYRGKACYSGTLSILNLCFVFGTKDLVLYFGIACFLWFSTTIYFIVLEKIEMMEEEIVKEEMLAGRMRMFPDTRR